MTDPVDIPYFVALIRPKALPMDAVKSWVTCVRDKAPAGLLTTVEVSTDDDGRRSARLIHRETTSEHRYIIPVLRALHEKEVERIVEAFCALHPEEDFDIVGTCMSEAEEPNSPTDEQSRYADLAKSWAKRQHQTWLTSRLKDGWRYGVNVSVSEKTHPLLRPWDDLPDRFKYVDLNEPQALLDVLGENGYVVISKPDLDAVLRLIQTIK